MAERKWNPQMVADRIEEAASTLQRLLISGLKPREYGNSWPAVVQEFMNDFGNEMVIRLGSPPADAISRMDEAMMWLRWLEPEQVRLVWLHAERVPRKLIMAKLGVSRATAWRQWMAALMTITTRLNVPDKRVAETSC